jgi:hypothetical protein
LRPFLFGLLKVDSDPRNQSSRFDKRRSRAERRQQDDGPEGARPLGRVIPLSPPIIQKVPVRGLLYYQGCGGFGEDPWFDLSAAGAKERHRNAMTAPKG